MGFFNFNFFKPKPRVTLPRYNRNVAPFIKWTPIRDWFNRKRTLASAKYPYSLAAAADQINRKVNSKFAYRLDGIKDIWMTPDEFERARGGDCEDFCIYKMHKLAEQGIPVTHTELVICFDRRSRLYHCVLRVFGGNNQYLLDNQTETLLTNDTFANRYTEIYGIGMNGWRLLKQV